MPKTSYQISQKGYVGGYDFDRSTVDKELDVEFEEVDLEFDTLFPGNPESDPDDESIRWYYFCLSLWFFL